MAVSCWAGSRAAAAAAGYKQGPRVSKLDGQPLAGGSVRTITMPPRQNVLRRSGGRDGGGSGQWQWQAVLMLLDHAFPACCCRRCRQHRVSVVRRWVAAARKPSPPQLLRPGPGALAAGCAGSCARSRCLLGVRLTRAAQVLGWGSPARLPSCTSLPALARTQLGLMAGHALHTPRGGLGAESRTLAAQRGTHFFPTHS